MISCGTGFVKSLFYLLIEVLNQDEMPIAEAFAFAYKVLFMLNSDPRALIGGMVIIIDASGATAKNVISDPNTIRAFSRFLQVSTHSYQD